MSSEDQRSFSWRYLRKIALPVAAVTLLVVLGVIGGLISVTRASDQASVGRQMKTVLSYVDGTVNQVAQEQEVVAIWDETVKAIRKPRLDQAWLDENVGAWLNTLFHHDSVFILSADGKPLYASIEGKSSTPAAAERLNVELKPLLDSLRATRGGGLLHDRLPGRPINHKARLRTSDRALHVTRLMALDGRPAAVSIMRITPYSAQVKRDAPGREPLMVSVRYLDGSYLAEIGQRSLIAGARFSTTAATQPGEYAAAIRGDTGERVGYLIWRPERPGSKMLALLAPVAGFALILFSVVMALMTLVLAQSQARLERSVRNLRLSEAEAVEQRHAAEVASLAKSDFLATMSHEIRTPLNAVVSAAHFLNQGQLDDGQRENVKMLQDASSVLLSLLNDVLDLSRIEAGKLVLEATPFALAGEARSVIALWEPRAVDKQITLGMSLADDLPPGIMVDPLRVKQILFNLLSNAIKFTEAGGVTLSVARTAEDIVFEVRDSGIGISAEGLGRVFGAFEQAESGTARRFGGSGMGLAISRRLAELMGGSLTATSDEGQGSTFRLTLPLVEAQAHDLDVEDGEVEEVSLEGLKVLVAEDHPVNRRVVELMLAPAGIELVFAHDGVEAVEAAGLQVFDVILMDMQMPRMDGLEATRRIHAGGLNAATPVIALTANAMPQHRDAWRAVGVDTMVSKPIDPQQLATALITAAAGYGAEVKAEAA